MKYPLGNFLANCPACSNPIGDLNANEFCSECGEPLPAEITSRFQGAKAANRSGQPGEAGKFMDDSPAGSPLPASRGSWELCVTIGVVLLLVGGYYLLNPSEEHASAVNLQRLAIGATASIVGAIFLASAVRPR